MTVVISFKQAEAAKNIARFTPDKDTECVVLGNTVRMYPRMNGSERTERVTATLVADHGLLVARECLKSGRSLEQTYVSLACIDTFCCEGSCTSNL